MRRQPNIFQLLLVAMATVLVLNVIGGSISEALGLMLSSILIVGFGWYMFTRLDALRHPNAFINYLHARNFQSQGKVTQALAHYDKALSMNPELETARRAKAELLQIIGQYSAARDVLQTAEPQKQKKDLFKMRIKSAQETENWQELVSICEDMMQDNPDHLESWLQRAQAYTNMERYADAKADYEHFIEKRSNYAPAYAGLGQVNLSLGDLEAAENAFNQAVEVSPRFAAAYAGRAFVRAMRDNLDGAYEDAEHAAQLAPQDAGTYLARGYVYAVYGEYQQAFDDFQYALELEPDYHYATAGIAITHRLQGNNLQSEAMWKTLVKRDPRYADIDWVLKQFGWQGDLAEAGRKIVSRVQA